MLNPINGGALLLSYWYTYRPPLCWGLIKTKTKTRWKWWSGRRRMAQIKKKHKLRERISAADNGAAFFLPPTMVGVGGVPSGRCSGKQPKDRSLTERAIVGQRGLEWVCVWSLNTVAHVPAGPFSRALTHTHYLHGTIRRRGRSKRSNVHTHMLRLLCIKSYYTHTTNSERARTLIIYTQQIGGIYYSKNEFRNTKKIKSVWNNTYYVIIYN